MNRNNAFVKPINKTAALRLPSGKTMKTILLANYVAHPGVEEEI